VARAFDILKKSRADKLSTFPAFSINHRKQQKVYFAVPDRYKSSCCIESKWNCNKNRTALASSYAVTSFRTA